jgi:hypothetical protein
VGIVRKSHRLFQRAYRGFDLAGFAEQCSAHQMHVGVGFEVDVVRRFQQSQARSSAVGSRHRERAIDPDRSNRAETLEQRVERGNLAPVRLVRAARAAVDGSDCGFSLVRTRCSGPESALEKLRGAADRVVVPAFPLLLGKRHRRSRSVEARIATRVVQEQEREQSCRLGHVGVGRSKSSFQPRATSGSASAMRAQGLICARTSIASSRVSSRRLRRSRSR